jgi:hypothetical protein
MIEKILFFQCDIGSCLERSNTDNVKVLTNSAGNLYMHEHIMYFLFVTLRICSLNMFVYSHYADFCKYYGRLLRCEWMPFTAKYLENRGYTVCCFDFQPQNL